ncbi:sporulation YhaL family protein [Sporolactobacillus vineae]|jgi:hypothetical protein|uniref:sporulation YhaL family protein n=1 Tax=Sporolactobacillus vineae TaxID=444463 RepID=UPI000288E081|nr:sporulation YhaL family protein [Sporolactobacillus vineae]
MKQAKRALYAIALLFLLFMMQQLGLIEPVITKLLGIAWWVYLVIAGILFSGYKAFTLSKQDKEIDDEWNEEQGNIFIRRMRDEKERRRNKKHPGAMQ